MSYSRLIPPTVALACLTPSVFALAAPDRGSADFFESRVRPLLAERCYSCHSARASRLQAGLRLDVPSGWIKGGTSGPALVAGDPEHSLLIQAIKGARGAPQMPPGTRLTMPRSVPAAVGATASAVARLGLSL